MINSTSGHIILGILISVFIIGWIPCQAQESELTAYEEWIEQNSDLSSYTLDELVRYRMKYQQEISKLEYDRDKLRQRGIRDGELFLSRHLNSKVGDKIMMRLAELYYEQSQIDFGKQMEDYDRRYALYDRGELLEAPAEPKKNLDDPLNLYTSVIENYPNSDLVDDAFYNIAFLLEEEGHADSAKSFYNKIEKEFTSSPLLPDVYMRLGEYYFNPPQNDLATATSYYQKILSFTGSPRYDEALYRMGWSYYRSSEYSKAIPYFTQLADDVDLVQPHDPLNNYSNPSLVDESVEYIGLSFLDYGGVQAAKSYLAEIGGREYGVNVFRRMGDAYLNEKEDYENSILAYTALLEMYPNHPTAPEVQNRIIQSYRRMENDSQAFAAREKLFSGYTEGSSWWANNTDKEARSVANQLAESAQRDNISVLLQESQETNDSLKYVQCIAESKRYLQAFPTDSMAVLIHWNMALTLDTKLKQTDQAYKEYMLISTKYWDSKYQQIAAVHAVALARDAALSAIAAAEEKASEEQTVTIEDLKAQAGKDRITNFREKMKLEPTELTDSELRLAEAYDNYIKLFPHASDTPLFLANAGALFYRHHQYRNSLRYFNTLLKHFPGSEEVNQARFAIMESYFGKGDFKSSEIVARRIVYGEGSDDIKSKARRRLAESIFLSAEIMADAEKHLAAGDEYRRVVKEAPRSEFADLALFNAALEYDKANEFPRAIETYNYLLASHPNSEYVLDVQNNLAFDYVELSDFRNAAMTYEQLATIHPDESGARDALYNSSLYFAKAEDWENAIKINTLFLQRFPDDDDADDLSFEIAGFYRQLNDLDTAQKRYNDFVLQYPDSPRTVEALFYRGDYFKQENKTKEAVIEYQRALAKSRELERNALDRNDYFAAESEFALANLKFEEFETIQFKMPEGNLNESKNRKKELLLEIIRHLGNCAAYGTVRIYESTYTIGLAYQEFAQTWAEQEIPELDETRAIVAQKEVSDGAIELYHRAADSYRNSISALLKISDQYIETLISEAGIADPTGVDPDTLDFVKQDTTIQVANSYIEKSKTKLSEVNYEIGTISFNSAIEVMAAPVPAGLGDFPELVYLKRVLDVAVAPLLVETLNAFKNNLYEGDTLNIDSQWIELSQQKLIATKNFVPEKYSILAMNGLDLLKQELGDYSNLLYSKKEENQLLNELQYSSDQIANLVDFVKGLEADAAKKYVETLEIATDLELDEKYVTVSKDSMSQSALLIAMKADTLSLNAKSRAEQAREMYLRTDGPAFEEGLFNYESTYFSLRGMEKQVLENGYNNCKSFDVDNIYAKNLALQLVRFDPAQYANILDLKVETHSFQSDTLWRGASTYYEGWVTTGFDDSMWPATRLASLENPSNIWFFQADVKNDTIKIEGSKEVKVVPHVTYTTVDRAYFRGAFELSGLPVECKIKILADGDFSLYFNGDLIKRMTSQDGPEESEFDVSDLLTKNKNVISLEVLDEAMPHNGVQIVTICKSLPGWDEKVKMLNPKIVSENSQN